MVYILENNNLRISVNTYGGELTSIFNKTNSTEYLWDGNPEGWKYHAPVLFPIVGKVKDLQYRVNGNTYKLPQHGLARISDFKMVKKDDKSIEFKLDFSEDTLKVYPFKFSLSCIYTILDNKVEVKYIVTNKDDKNIYFSIGSHPAFMCPIADEDKIEDCYLEFNKKEKASIRLLTNDGYFNRSEEPYMDNTNVINLKEDTFKNDALVFSGLKSSKVSIKSRNHDKFVTVDFTGFPDLGIWSPLNNARLICIEPWYGHADYCDFDGDFREKEGVINLPKDKQFKCFYTIEIN